MYAQIRTVVFDCPDPGLLASFYAALLVMPARLIETAQRVVIGNEQAGVNLGFLQIEDYRPPSWPELAYPQQLHLDIPVYDKRIPAELVLDLGATRLPKMGGGCPVYADPAGHPFCLCDNSMNGGPEMPALPGLVGNIVVDCLAPQRLASFYATLLGIRVRMMDSPGWVVLVRQPGVLPRLAFQGSCGDVPGWRDRRRPQQLHLEIEVDDPSAAGGAMKRFGLRRLDDGESVYADPAGHAFRLVPAARSVRENVSQPTQGSGFGEVAAGLAQREIIGGSNEEARVAFQCPTPQQADALDQVLIDLRARPGVIGVLLCGSMARGTARADSDIDLLVVLGAGTSGFDLHEVGGQVEIEQTRRTVTGWTEQFSPTRPGDESWGYAFLDGVILYDPEGAVARLVATAVEAHAAYRVPPAVRAHYLVLWRHVRPKMEAVLAGGNAIEIGWAAAVMMNQVVETLWAINDLPLPSRDIGCLHRHLPDLTVPDNAQALVEAMLTSSPRTALRIQLQLLEAAQIALVKAGISGVENGQAELGES